MRCTARLILVVTCLIPRPASAQDAEALYQSACDDGDLTACNVFGLMLEAGEVVQQDLPRAAGLFELVCNGGLAAGCSNLALLYETGLGVPQDYSRAAELYRRACDAGAPDACVSADALGTPGRIVGTVTEPDGRPLADVEVTLLGRASSTLTNQQGRFSLSDVQPGPSELRLARLGYEPRSVPVRVESGTTLDVRATMSIDVIELEPIRVSVRAPFLELNGFYERAESGRGSQFTAEDIMAVETKQISEFLRGRVPGVRIALSELGPWSRAVSSRTSGFQRGECTLPVYLDGIRLFEPMLDRLEPEAVEGVEVYSGVASLPSRFVSSNNACGVVLIWSKRGY